MSNVKTKAVATTNKMGKFLDKHTVTITVCLLMAVMVSGMVFATGSTQADALWGTLTNLIELWVTRLGGVVMFIGGVMFGLGWKSDDAEQKSRGISTIIAGGIVAAVAGIASQFFA